MIIVLCGASGSGKNTIIDHLRKKNKTMKYVRSYCSRNPRQDDGNRYIYVSQQEFERMIADNDFVEYTEYNGHYYGTPKEVFKDENNIYLMDLTIDGAMNLKKIYLNVLIIYIYTDENTLIQRLKNRKTNKNEEIEKRMDIARKEYQNIYLVLKDIDLIINNSNQKVEETVNLIIQLIMNGAKKR